MTESPYAIFMREALALAEQGRWRVAPNPTVGAVLVRDGVIVARGWHKEFGLPHAEIECLRDAEARGVNPADCILVVTLEPCRHTGKTPPCVDAIIAAGIRHVVIGAADVHEKAGGGATLLRDAGITVDMGVLERECRDMIADFITWQTTDRPYIILKMASTLDGHIATASGSAERITNEASRERVMELRAGVGLAGGAVLVGGNTLTSDNPRLTARIDTVKRQPLAAVVLSRLPGLDTTYHLTHERPAESIFFSSAAQAASPNALALRKKGARVYAMPRASSGMGLDMTDALETLRREEQCLYVLCEGGAHLALSLLEAGLVDEFHLHLAPLVLGTEGAKPLFAGRNTEKMEEALRLRTIKTELVQGDIHLLFRPER